jgi:hypothetical protein
MPVVLAPAEVLAGLIAVMVLLCAVLIANILKAILNSVNFLGLLSPLIGAADWLASHALTAMSWLWDKTNPVAVWIALTNVLHSTEQGLLGVVAGDLLNAVQRIVTVTIPAAANWAWSQAQGSILGLSAFVRVLFNTAEADIAAARAWVAGYIQAVQAWTLSQIGVAVNTLRSDIAGVWQAAQALVATVRSDLVALHQFVTTTVLGRIGAVEQEIALELPKIEAEIGQIATVAIPGLTLAITAVRDIVTEVEQCTAPLCEGGVAKDLGGLGKILGELAPLLEGGLLFAFVAAAAENPAGVARDVEAVLTPIVDDAKAAFGVVTHVAA